MHIPLHVKVAMWVAFVVVLAVWGTAWNWFVRDVLPHSVAVGLGVCAIGFSAYVYGGDLVRWWRPPGGTMRLKPPPVRRQIINGRVLLGGLAAIAVVFLLASFVSEALAIWGMVALCLIAPVLYLRDEWRWREERDAKHVENLMAYALDDAISPVDGGVVREHDLDAGARQGRLPRRGG